MPPTTHPLNDGFEIRRPRPPFRAIRKEQARRWTDRGFFVLENAFDQASIEEVCREIDPHEAKVEEFLRQQENGRYSIARAGEISFTTHLVTKSQRLRAFCAGAIFRDLAFDLLGPEVRLYWDQAVYKKPGTESPFPWHQDNGYNYLEPQCYLTCWVALTDATEDNGCPWVVPGLHRLGTLEHWRTDLGFQCVEDPEEAVPVPAAAGSIVVFSSLTPHATGPNRTDETRKAYIVQFAPDGACQVKIDADGQRVRVSQDTPERQFLILENGHEPGGERRASVGP